MINPEGTCMTNTASLVPAKARSACSVTSASDIASYRKPLTVLALTSLRHLRHLTSGSQDSQRGPCNPDASPRCHSTVERVREPHVALTKQQHRLEPWTREVS